MVALKVVDREGATGDFVLQNRAGKGWPADKVLIERKLNVNFEWQAK